MSSDSVRRVLHVFEMGIIGGQFRVVEALAVAQRSAGIDASVLAVVNSQAAAEHPMLEAMDANGVRVIRLRLPGPRSYLTERREVVTRARSLGVQVVHTHGYRADVVDSLAAGRAGFATVSTLHGFIGGGLRNRLYEHLQRWATRRLDAVVAVSEPMRRRLQEGVFPPRRVHVVPNALVPTEVRLASQEARSVLGLTEAFNIGWIGRVSHEKGPDVLVDALAGMPYRGVVASVIGDGPLRRDLQQRTGSENLPVRWHGVIQNAESLYPAFDCVVLSSRTEGTPMVLLEAMAAGVPVVATRVGGIPHVVSEREAWLVPPEDPAALRAAIMEVRENPEAAAARADAAKEKLARDFQPASWVEAYQRVYQSAVEHREGRT